MRNKVAEEYKIKEKEHRTEEGARKVVRAEEVVIAKEKEEEERARREHERQLSARRQSSEALKQVEMEKKMACEAVKEGSHLQEDERIKIAHSILELSSKEVSLKKANEIEEVAQVGV